MIGVVFFRRSSFQPVDGASRDFRVRTRPSVRGRLIQIFLTISNSEPSLQCRRCCCGGYVTTELCRCGGVLTNSG